MTGTPLQKIVSSTSSATTQELFLSQSHKRRIFTDSELGRCVESAVVKCGDDDSSVRANGALLCLFSVKARRAAAEADFVLNTQAHSTGVADVLACLDRGSIRIRGRQRKKRFFEAAAELEVEGLAEGEDGCVTTAITGSGVLESMDLVARARSEELAMEAAEAETVVLAQDDAWEDDEKEKEQYRRKRKSAEETPSTTASRRKRRKTKGEEDDRILRIGKGGMWTCAFCPYWSHHRSAVRRHLDANAIVIDGKTQYKCAQ